MSAFLGPIHHWVFHKIQFQNEIVNRLIDFAKQKNLDIAPALKERYGELENAPLEDMIDTSNIHGWLQERVTQVEYRLAAAVKMILDSGTANEDELRRLFYEIGSSAKPAELTSAVDGYALLNDLLLDGMPCDRVNEVVSESSQQVVWRKNVCTHSPYWDAAGIDIQIYNTLRESLIAGLLDNSDYEFIKNGEEYTIKRR